jgi:hypothetical protein
MPVSSSSSSMAVDPTYSRGVYLQRYLQETYDSDSITGFRFKVVAYGAYGMPDTIFRYGKEALSAKDGTYRLAFDGVCSPADLEEFPEDDPTPDSYPEFCRLNYVDLVFRSQSIADEAWKTLVEEVSSLITTMNIMDQVKPQATLKIGDPPPASPPPESSSGA